MAKNDRIWHEGIIKSITSQTIEVVISNHSACSGCHAKGACGMSETQQKIIVAECPNFEVHTGEKVTVYASMNNAIYAVLIAYVYPSIILIGLIALLLALGIDETAAAMGAFVGCCGYAFYWCFNRKKISNKIKFYIEKSNNVQNQKESEMK